LNRVADIAAVATGCSAANCDAARAACGATASRVGARASVFDIQQGAGAVGDAPQLRGGRLADPGEERQLGAGNSSPTRRIGKKNWKNWGQTPFPETPFPGPRFPIGRAASHP